MKLMIMSGGSMPSKDLICKEAADSDIIIGVDKGIDYLSCCNIVPSIMVGDFDSINENTLATYMESDQELIRYPTEKDYTDTQIAVMKALELDADEIVLLGCTGNRMDHTMGNIGLLYHFLKANKKAYIKDDNNTIFMIDKYTWIECEKACYFSLIPFGGNVKGLTIKGAKYELEKYDLAPYNPITISNEFISERNVKLEFEDGVLVVFYSRD